MSNKMMKELLLYFPAKMLEGIAGIAMISIYTRILSVEMYGRYGLLNSLVMMASLLLGGWLMHATNRHIVQVKEDDKTSFLSTVFTSWLVLQVVFLVVLGAIYILVPPWRPWLPFAVILFSPYSGVQLLTPMMTVTKQVRASIALSTGTVVMKVVLVLLLWRHFNPWWTIMLVHGGVDFFWFSVILIRSHYLKYWRLKDFSMTSLKGFFSYGMPLIGMALAMSITNLSDRFLISYIQDDAAVGIYTANYAVASAAFTLLMVGVMRAVYPNILNEWRLSQQESTGLNNGRLSQQESGGIERVIWQGLRIFWIVALPATAGISILSRVISERIVEINYVVGYPIMGWVSLAMLILGTTEYIIKPLELSKNTRPIFIASAIAASVNLGLNLILIPKWGYMAAAFTTLLAYCVYGAFLFQHVIKRHPVYIDKSSTFRLLLATGVMSGFAWIFRNWVTSWWQLGVVIGVSMVVYFGVLALTGELKQEWSMISAKIRRT